MRFWSFHAGPGQARRRIRLPTLPARSQDAGREQFYSEYRSVLALAVIWLLAAVAVLPVILHWTAPPPSALRTHLAIDLSYAGVAVICFGLYRLELRRLNRSQAFALVFLVFLLSNIANQLHSVYVDHSSSYFGYPNAVWQEMVQKLVVELSPAGLPHSYRLLPNAMVFWMQLGGVRFDAARDIYRLITELLLFYSIYQYARFYTTYLGGLLTILLVAAVYPISFEWYAGQLTDPLSQLSFVLAFIFLEIANFPFFFTTLLIGSLAKEMILVLCGFYVLFCRKEKRYGTRAVVLCVGAAAVFFGVRVFVLRGALHYYQINGTYSLLEHWRDPKWRALFLITAGAYMPFLVLGWKQTPTVLKRLALYLTPVVFVVSVVFGGWLSETRYWMPEVFVWAVIAARWLAGEDAKRL